jgi:hypothetical protein
MIPNKNPRFNLDSIKNEVSNLFNQVDTKTSNDKIFERNVNQETQMNGYADPLDLYRKNQNSNSEKMMKGNQLMNQQNSKLIDNRLELYPNSELTEIGNLRKVVIENNTGGTPFKNAHIRDDTLPYDSLLSEEEKKLVRERAQQNLKSINDNNRQRYTAPNPKDERDNRFNLYPLSNVNEYGNERDKQIQNPSAQQSAQQSAQTSSPTLNTNMNPGPFRSINQSDTQFASSFNELPNYNIDGSANSNIQPFNKNNEGIYNVDGKSAPPTGDKNFQNFPNNSRSINNINPSNDPNFENSSQRTFSKANAIGANHVFDHAQDRDRVGVNPRESYRSAYYESTDKNQLDVEVTYDKNKNLIKNGIVNYPNGDVFTHAQARDRVPIDPKDLYRNSQYASTPYNQLDLDVDKTPTVAFIAKTADQILNREFEINNDNRTSKDEASEVSMIHTPYTPLDKFNKSDVLFKNINEKKPQIDVLNEYIVNIDSSDRNFNVYPNPYKMRVLFNAGSDFATTTFDPKTGQRSSGIIDGANPDLKILRYFENIKYLRLETASFPRYYSLVLKAVNYSTISSISDTNEQTIITAVCTTIDTNKNNASYNFLNYINSYAPPTGYTVQYVNYKYTSSSSINAKIQIVNTTSVIIAYEIQYAGALSATCIINRYILDTTKDLSTDRFLMLNLDEITDNTQNSTSGKSQYNYLYPDYITTYFFYGDNHFVDKIYRNAKLGSIKNLTITISDSFGNLINGGQYIDTTVTTTKTDNPSDNPTTYNYPSNYIRHPLYKYTQVNLMFKIGCYETDIDKKIFY